MTVRNRNIDIMNTPLSQIDLRSMEEIIRADPWVASAQVFIDNERVLHMYVTQRIPVVRVFQENSASYYLDTTLSILPLTRNYQYYTTVVTNVPELKNDSIGWGTRQQIVMLARALQADTFWNAQISHVSLDSAGMFELMPVLGSQTILFGDTADIKGKLANLFVFYKDVLNRIGWDKYEKLDVRFNGEVIASPSLPYQGPVDKAVASMNWITSIIETQARSDEKDSVLAAQAKANRALMAEKAMARRREKVAALAKARKKTAKPAGKGKQEANKKKQKHGAANRDGKKHSK